MELWFLFGIVLTSSLFAVGVIFTQGWLIGVGFVVIPLVAIWGLWQGWSAEPHKP